MTTPLLLVLAAAFVISSAIVFKLSQKRRQVLLDRISFHRRRTSGSNTPPRSLSPKKGSTEDVSTPDYSKTLPPSRRSALKTLQGLPAPLSTKLQDLLEEERSLEEAKPLPLTASYLKTGTTMLTPCGFSTDEIKALGDFPDYATLSGVPLPQPYHDFDIKKAKPRPYRPFRWNYHQTMCK